MQVNWDARLAGGHGPAFCPRPNVNGCAAPACIAAGLLDRKPRGPRLTLAAGALAPGVVHSSAGTLYQEPCVLLLQMTVLRASGLRYVRPPVCRVARRDACN